MARHVFTLEEKIAGTRKSIKALESKRGGPKWLIPGLKKYLKRLLKEKRG